MKLMKTLLLLAFAGLAAGQGVIFWTKPQVSPIKIVVPLGMGGSFRADPRW
jgi:hypothetical protein